MLDTMPKKGKKKSKVADDESDVEITPTPRVEIIYEDTKSVTEAKPKFKWGHIYHMLQEKIIPDARLEDVNLFNKILRLGITKVSTRPGLFPCPEVIGWILYKDDARGMIMYNVEDKGFSSFTLAFIAKAYSLPPLEVSMTTHWINNLTIDYIGVGNMMVAEGNTLLERGLQEFQSILC